MLSVHWSGHDFNLLAERALHWIDQSALIIADAHFGKAASFRAAGVPVPAGTTSANLQQLDRALRISAAERLIILGDFLHARDGRSDSTMSLLEKWRLHHANLHIVLVRGNHDQHAGDPPADWRVQCVDEPWLHAGMALCHEPCLHKRCPVIAGHVHPCVRLHDVDGSGHRASCFLFRKRQVIMPAFGSFTGAHLIRAQRGDRVFVVGPDEVVEARGQMTRA